MNSYVVGFAFDHGKEHVLLIRKNRPQWQMGRYNGVGGHIRQGEKPVEAMVREFAEEAGYVTQVSQWKPLLRIIDKEREPAGEVFFFFTEIDIEACRSMTDEKVLIFPAVLLDALDTLSNTQWLVPMAMDEDFKETFLIEYEAEQPPIRKEKTQ
ncbi:MAG: NUDIX domain-containing protein [Syntrophales bacterium]|jgi:8-oxo-dGTP diphosphatase|nr:NUDIX domain-containing protein [Syntrophales bacterium]MCK9390284.1 NUDIX domain-containing protein [Syntrophales bacterium]